MSLKRLLGNTPERDIPEEMRTILREMQQERRRFEALVQSAGGTAERLGQLSEPIAKAGSEVDAVTTRLGSLEQRLQAVSTMASQLQALGERSEELSQSHKQVETLVADVAKDTQQVRSLFEELAQKVDLAVDLKGRLEGFLEIEKPFQALRAEAEGVRSQVEGTGEHLVRLREQHDRLMDAHKLATSKMEALDRRREELSRDLQDKERRIIGVEQAVRGMDGVRQTVDDVRRSMGSLKTLSDSLAQKTAMLEAQSEAVERALAQADSLDRAIKQVDAGVRQQLENEKTLAALQEHVAELHTLHDNVMERSREIALLQRQTEETTEVIRHEIAAARDDMKNSVDRFDFESKGLESVSQRVADLRGALADFEHRFKGLAEASQTTRELSIQTQSLTTHLQNLQEESLRIDDEVKKLQAIRRELDEATATSRALGVQVARIEEGRPDVEAVLRDFQELSSTHALVKDSLEQAKIAHAEVARLRDTQSETRTWLTDVQRTLGDMRERVGEIHEVTPKLEVVEKQAERIVESMEMIESRREFVEELHRRLTDLGAVSTNLDERGRQLQTRMDAAEQRFATLSAHADEAERIANTVAGVTSGVIEAKRRTDAITKTVAAIEDRCESVQGIAERTNVLRQELEQRHQSLREAAKNLQRSAKLRQEAAAAAEQLEELSKRLGEAIGTAEGRVTHIDGVSRQLEDRVSHLKVVDKRLAQFEERLAKWELVDQEVARSLDQISARQNTVQTLQADLDRMFVTAEKTSADVRAITSAQRQISDSTTLLHEVMGRLREIQEMSSALDERRRQTTEAEERLARAEGFLVDVRTSLETLQGQKVMVDQAVEKAGSLRFLLKQAEAAMESLREERKMTADVRAAVEEVDGSDATRAA